MVMSVYKAQKFHQVEEEGFRKSEHKGTYQNVSRPCVADGNEKSRAAADAFLMCSVWPIITVKNFY